MDLQMWLVISCLLIKTIRAEPTVQPPEPKQSVSSQQKPQQRYKEVIMYLTPSQIKSLESGEGYIVPHQSAKTAVLENSQQQDHVYQTAQLQPQNEQHQLQQQLHQRQQQQQQQQQLHHQQQQELQQHQVQQQSKFKQQQELYQQDQQELLHQQQQQEAHQQQQLLHQQQLQELHDEVNRKHRLHLEEAIQNQPTSLVEQNAYEQHLNQQNLEQWIPQSYPQVQKQIIPQQLTSSSQDDRYLQFGKSQPRPENYAYMYFYPSDKSHGNENIQLEHSNQQYSEKTKFVHLKPNSNQNLQLIEAPNRVHHSFNHFDQQKHKQLINYLVPNKFQLIPYDYSRDHTLDDLLAQQNLESQHLQAHQQIQQQVKLEAQQQAHQEVEQLQHQLQAQHQIELETQHQVQNQIQLDLQHKVLQEAQHQIQQTQHEIEQSIKLQNQHLGQLESLQQAHLPFQQTQQHTPLQTEQKPLEVETVLPQDINLKELEDHIKQHIKSQKLHSQQAQQKAMIQQIENEKQKEIEIANMDAHHESQQIKAEQVKADELIKSGKIRAQQIEAQIVAENLETFAKIGSSRSIGKTEKVQALFTPSNLHQNIINSLNQNTQKLESGFAPIGSSEQDHSNNKLPKEVEQILLKNEVEKQKALTKAAKISQEPPRVIKEEIKVVKRPQEIRVKEIRVPTPVYVPYPKPIEVKMPQPFIVPVEVIRPFPVPIVHTEKVEVEKPVPVEVNKVVHVPVTKNVYVPVEKPYIVEKLVPFEVEKKVPVPVHINKPQKYTIIRHVWKH